MITNSTDIKDISKFFNKLRKGKPLVLSSLLRSLRLCDEISQLDFAKKLGVSKQYLCDIEHGRKGISPRKAVDFAKKLGHDPMLFVELSLQEVLEKEALHYTLSVRKG